jgi:uncharacterized protein (TIGR02466 family)
MEDTLTSLWPTNILHKTFLKHNEVKDELLNFVQEYKNKIPEGRNGSENLNLYESRYDIVSYINEYPCLKELIDFIGLSFKEIAFITNKDVWRIKEIDPSKISAKITSMWFIDYCEEGFVFPHIHTGCSWSMVYYLSSPPSAKDDPIAGTHFVSPLNKADSDDLGNAYSHEATRNIIPSEGEALFFPSTIVHSTYPIKGDRNKIIFSANCAFVEIK